MTRQRVRTPSRRRRRRRLAQGDSETPDSTTTTKLPSEGPRSAPGGAKRSQRTAAAAASSADRTAARRDENTTHDTQAPRPWQLRRRRALPSCPRRRDKSLIPNAQDVSVILPSSYHSPLQDHDKSGLDATLSIVISTSCLFCMPCTNVMFFVLILRVYAHQYYSVTHSVNKSVTQIFSFSVQWVLLFFVCYVYVISEGHKFVNYYTVMHQ